MKINELVGDLGIRWLRIYLYVHHYESLQSNQLGHRNYQGNFKTHKDFDTNSLCAMDPDDLRDRSWSLDGRFSHACIKYRRNRHYQCSE